jgi:hypothetical protein
MGSRKTENLGFFGQLFRLVVEQMLVSQWVLLVSNGFQEICVDSLECSHLLSKRLSLEIVFDLSTENCKSHCPDV